MVRKFFLSCIAILSAISVFSQSQGYSSLINEAAQFYKAQKYEASFLKYQSAFILSDNVMTDLYDAACSAALCGKRSDSFILLNKAIDKGFVDKSHLEKDCDLQSLHGTSEFGELFLRIYSNLLSIKTFDQVIDELFINQTSAETISKYFVERDSKPDTLRSFFLGKQEDIKSITKEEFQKRVILLHTMAQENCFKSFGALQKETISTTNSFSSNASNASNEANSHITIQYILTPRFHNADLTDFLIKPAGYVALVEYTQFNNGVKINNLSIDSCYFRNTIIKDEYLSFLSNLDTINFRCGIIKADKKATANTFLLSSKEIVKNLTFDSNEDGSPKTESIDQTLYFISFYKKVTLNKGTFNESRSIQTFEVVFGDRSHLVYISDGAKWGYFQIRNLTNWKNFITAEIRSID